MNFVFNSSNDESGPVPWPMPPKLQSDQIQPASPTGPSDYHLKRVHSKGITKAIALSPAPAQLNSPSSFQQHHFESPLFLSDTDDDDDDDDVEVDSFSDSHHLDAQVPTLRSVNKLFSSNDSHHQPHPSNSTPKSQTQTSNPTLRRPIASRRNKLIDISHNHPQTTHPQNAARKGILTRTTTQHKNLTGICRAESGLIMSKHQLTSSSTSNLSIPDIPVPKSLRPWILQDSKTPPDSMLLSPASNPYTRTPTPTQVNTSTNTPSYSSSTPTTDHHLLHHNTNSWHFSEGQSSAGLVARLSTGFKKATSAFGKRSAADIIKSAETDIVIAGTIDEAVCRICATCRNSMGYRVVVKKTGRKIRVESTQHSGDDYLKAVLLIRPLGDDMCAINVRQSRTDGTRTPLATLWMFYQRLDKELRPDWQLHSSLFAEGSPTP